jgi:hypothetical protein
MEDERASAHDAPTQVLRSKVLALVPEPRLVERVIHGQRVTVKVFPSISDPSWSSWIREVVRAPVDPWYTGEGVLASGREDEGAAHAVRDRPARGGPGGER